MFLPKMKFDRANRLFVMLALLLGLRLLNRALKLTGYRSVFQLFGSNSFSYDLDYESVYDV